MLAGTAGKSGWLKAVVIPVALTIAIIGLIEASIQAIYHPNLLDRSAWLLHDPYRGESFDRVMLYEKLTNLEDTDPDIISVGDSSGLFSLQTTIINRYTHGARYVNFSTGANHATDGYLAVAEHMLSRSKNIKYVVLHMVPQLVPSNALIKQSDLGGILYNNISSWRSYASPPSGAFSAYAKKVFFEHRIPAPNEPMTMHAGALQYEATVKETLGWLPEFDVRFPRISGIVDFYDDHRNTYLNYLGFGETSTINYKLDEFDRMVRSHGAKLVIAFTPFPIPGIRPNSAELKIVDQQLERFQREHPDVIFLFPLITNFGREKFGGFNHISREYTFLSSKRLGDALGRLVENPASFPPYKAQFKDDGIRHKTTWTETGPKDPVALEAALALYLYANTADEKYWNLLSHRVQEELKKDQAFGFMMDDTRKRIADLAAKGIQLSYDTSQLQAVPATMTDMPFCVSNPNFQWYHISGAMIFGYDEKAKGISSREPVQWPATSEIFLPTVTENGVRKFDGYCPEPSLAHIADVTETKASQTGARP